VSFNIVKFDHKETDDCGMNIWIQAYENIVDQNGDDFEGRKYNDINKE